MSHLLHALAGAPRPTGGVAIAAARARCARELSVMGFEVRERAFEFSAFPGRYAMPLFGAATAILVGVASLAAARGARFLPLIVLGVGTLALALAGRWLARHAVLHARVLRRGGVNLEATRAGDAPSLWLSAHLDTKSQPVPTLLRTIGIILESIGVLLTGALAAAAALGAAAPITIWAAAVAMTLAGAVPVVSSVVGSASPGALDNASGVAAVIDAARLMGSERGVGVLITDAEELGLAGARAWAGERRDGVVLNCDGVDDGGVITVMYSGRRPTRVIEASTRASTTMGVALRARRLPLGILTDSVAFGDAGLESVTFSRGTFRSLARVHSSRDDVAHLHGDGIPETAALMAATARALL